MLKQSAPAGTYSCVNDRNEMTSARREALSELIGQSLPHPTRPNFVWAGCRFVLRLFFVFWLGYRARGMKKVPASGGGLLLINHQSFLDPLLAGAPLARPVSYIARDSLFPVPVIGWILRHTYVMPIHRESAGASVVKESVRRMRHGFLVGVFPEGTRSRDGSVGEMKPGFVSLVRRSDVPIYPVGIAGANEAMPPGVICPRPRRVRVVFGDPLTRREIDRYTGSTSGTDGTLVRCPGREEELVELVRRRIIACQREAEEWRRQ